MIERQFVKDNFRLFRIEEYLAQNLKGVGLSHVRVQRTPLGDQIIIHASRPGLIVGRKGANIKSLTNGLKKRFDLNNPQIEISEVDNPRANAHIVAEKMATALESFGSNRFKGIMHKALEEVLGAGALGVEIVMSGKLPSSRARSWRVYGGYLKKCGDSVVSQMDIAYAAAQLKTGTVGIKVSILPAGVILPDKVKILSSPEAAEQAAAGTALGHQEAQKEAEEANEEPAKEKKKSAPRKKSAPKKKKEEATPEAPTADAAVAEETSEDKQ